MTPRILRIIFLVGFGLYLTRALLSSDFRNSAVLYVGIPFVVAVLMHFLVPDRKGRSLFANYLNRLKDGTILLLVSSVFLFEGFICVLMFMPIYYLFLTIGLGFAVWKEKRSDHDKGSLGAYIVPVIIILMSLEGLSEPLSLNRYETATFSKIVDADITTLKTNMAKPISLPKERHWFLSVFPLPVSIEAGSLSAGDVHKIHYVYKKRFFTNIDEGEIHLKIAEVGEDYVKTQIVLNTSYLGNYVDFQGSEINFSQAEDGTTKVSLTLKYRRLLDPAWYFGPMQGYAMDLMAEYLLETVIERAHVDS